jgi:hypothetical protein
MDQDFGENGEEDRCEDRDNGDNNEQFDERKTALLARLHSRRPSQIKKRK